MIIHVLCNDGSPLGVVPMDVYGNAGRIGVGGAELALFTMCDLWSKDGHEVVLYNNPRIVSDTNSLFTQASLDSFEPRQSRDFVIVFRSPNERVCNNYVKGKKIWWSCDQYTVGDFRSFAPKMDAIVCISPHHKDYFWSVYGIDGVYVIDLPVRDWDYEGKTTKKKPNSLLFSSVPDRGLSVLRKVFPLIRQQFSDVTLTITSDYRLWGTDTEGNTQHRLDWMGESNVNFVGAVERSTLNLLQCESEILAYPCVYNELFCYSIAEAEFAGCIPVTSDVGACGTTNLGEIIAGNPLDDVWQRKFVDTVVMLLKNPSMKHNLSQHLVALSAVRFSPKVILSKWNNVFRCLESKK